MPSNVPHLVVRHRPEHVHFPHRVRPLPGNSISFQVSFAHHQGTFFGHVRRHSNRMPRHYFSGAHHFSKLPPLPLHHRHSLLCLLSFELLMRPLRGQSDANAKEAGETSNFSTDFRFLHIIYIFTFDQVTPCEFGQQRVHRTMSCPARVVDQKQTLPMGLQHEDSSGLGFLADLRRDFVSTIKTLAMLFVYLLMSSPLYISTVVHNNCSDETECRRFNVYLVIFYHISMVGLIIYPYMWLLLDKQFTKRIFRICRRLRNK